MLLNNGIIDSNGAFVVKYAYNGYGDVTVTQDTSGLATLNPFRWKGYYFDQESGMYYCHTRYYVPEWCRWLNADSPNFIDENVLEAMNLFSYCGNDPIMGYDPSGALDWERIGKGVLIIAGAALVAALTVATVGAGSIVGGMIISGAIGAAGELFSQTVIENKSFTEVNYLQVAISAASSAASAIPGVGYLGSVMISGIAGVSSALVGGMSIGDSFLQGLRSASITAVAGGIVRGIGLGKMAKLGSGNYAKKKIFLNRIESTKLNNALKGFNPAINKSETFLGYIRNCVGIRGISSIAKDTAGTYVNTIVDIITSIF